MSKITTKDKTIAKNAFMLYARMLLAMAVSLYTSRIVLQTLGVVDYGVYSIVGGIVGMLGFLKATMSGATSRFLTFELGKGDFDKLSKTFNSALIVHIALALIFLFLAETIGLWFLYNKIIIPENRMSAAVYVYHFSIFCAIISITQVPYSASIISHEKMDIYAYVEILHVLLKLGIVYLLVIGNFDKLILYSILVTCVTFIIAMIYRIYCIYHYKECVFQLQIDKTIIKKMLSFSIYNIFGNFGNVFNYQGTNIVINLFFGVTYNAASGLAATVANMVTAFSNTIITVFRPPIIKAYAKGEFTEVEKYTLNALNISTYILFLIAIPAIVEMNTLFQIWLVEVPDGAVLFARLIIISILFQIIRYIITIDIHATGKVKFVNLINGILMTFNPFVIYFLYKLIQCVMLAYICNIIIQFILIFNVLYFANRYIPTLSKRKIIYSLIRIFTSAIITFIFTYFFSRHYISTFIGVIYTTIISSLILSFLTFYFCLNSPQRQIVISAAKNKFNNYIK